MGAALTRGARLPLRPVRADGPEWMDLPGRAPAVLEECLDELGRMNRLFGGHRLTLSALEEMAGDLPAGSGLDVIDIATGGGDFPRAIAAWAARRGLEARILATDLDPEILGMAAQRGTSGGAIKFAVADARRLPYPDHSFDVAACSLTLHHLEPEDALPMLWEMRRVARRGVIVNDLVRSWFAYLATLLATRVASKNPYLRHDGPLSVRRAYTRGEMSALAARAGLGPVRFKGAFGYRVAMSARGAS